MNLPKWSIIVIGYNNEQHLEKCLEHILTAVKKINSYEIIYVDAGSNDNSLLIAKKFPIDIILTNEKVNVSVARNLGLQIARGEYVQFIDADIYISEDWLLIAEKTLDNEIEVGMVCGQLIENTKNVFANYISYSWTKRRVGYLKTPIGGGGAIRKKIILELGGYNINLMRGQETELGQRLVSNGYKILGLDVIYGYHNLNVNNLKQFVLRTIIQGKNFSLVFLNKEKTLSSLFLMARKNYLIFIILVLLNTLFLINFNFLLVLIINFIFCSAFFFEKSVKKDLKTAFILFIEKILVILSQIFFTFLYFLRPRVSNRTRIKSRGLVYRYNQYHRLNKSLIDLSIIVIGKNLGESLKVCLDSIRLAVSKLTLLSYELIYVDSNSNDNSILNALNSGFKTIIIKPNRFTPGIARNIGWINSRGKFLCFIDGDILVDEMFFYNLEQFILNNSDENLATMCGQLEEANNHELVNYLSTWRHTKYGEIDYPIGGGGVFKREYFEEIGGYDINLLRGEETIIGEKIKNIGGKIYGMRSVLGIHDLKIKNIKDFFRQINKHSIFYATILIDNNKNCFTKIAKKNLLYFISLILYIVLCISLILNNNLFYLIVMNLLLFAISINKILHYSFLFILEKFYLIISQSIYILKFLIIKRLKANTFDDMQKFVEVSQVIDLYLIGKIND